MVVLYINEIHGLPDLDLKLEIDGENVTATLYSANPAGGYFSYESGIEYAISAGGIGFSINTGAFSYDTSGEVIKTQSGAIGTGTLFVIGNCFGGTPGCFSSDDTGSPAYNSSNSAGIDTNKLTVNHVADQYLDTNLNGTVIVEYTGLSTPPSFLGFTGDYIENSMSANIDLGTGTFQYFEVKPKATSSGPVIATYDKSYSNWTFTDTELLTIYQGCGGGSGEQQIYLELTITTTDGATTETYPIKIGGTSWINNGSWKRTVPYTNISGTNKPCVMYTNINNIWRRGTP